MLHMKGISSLSLHCHYARIQFWKILDYPRHQENQTRDYPRHEFGLPSTSVGQF
jgi:hypothetical protein